MTDHRSRPLPDAVRDRAAHATRAVGTPLGAALAALARRRFALSVRTPRELVRAAADARCCSRS